MLSVIIASHICYIWIYLMDNDIIAQNVMLFISTFSLFLGNFFVVYRNFIIKDTIINKQLRTDHEHAIFCIFYWHCYRKVTEKKNELYLSSLLKKHMNDCDEPECCCHHRSRLYDHGVKIFGNPKQQPHFDRVFIRHYIRKLFNNGLKHHPKSMVLTFLLAYYNIEILEMATQTTELIRQLSKLQQK